MLVFYLFVCLERVEGGWGKEREGENLCVRDTLIGYLLQTPRPGSEVESATKVCALDKELNPRPLGPRMML